MQWRPGFIGLVLVSMILLAFLISVAIHIFRSRTGKRTRQKTSGSGDGLAPRASCTRSGSGRGPMASGCNSSNSDQQDHNSNTKVICEIREAVQNVNTVSSAILMADKSQGVINVPGEVKQIEERGKIESSGDSKPAGEIRPSGEVKTTGGSGQLALSKMSIIPLSLVGVTVEETITDAGKLSKNSCNQEHATQATVCEDMFASYLAKSLNALETSI